MVAPIKRGRGRPKGDFARAIECAPPAYLTKLAGVAESINGEFLPNDATAAEISKTRREIMQVYQVEGGLIANETRINARAKRLEIIAKALADPLRNVGRLSDIRAAEMLSLDLKLSKHTLRRDIAELRKLIGPT